MEKLHTESMEHRRATIKDVAAEAGVSIKTVSLYLGGKRKAFSAVTAQRIQAAIDQLHYTPSSHARALRGGFLDVIGILGYYPPRQIDTGRCRYQLARSYHERLWAGVAAEADRLGQSLLIYPTSMMFRFEDVKPLLTGGIDALIYLSDSSLAMQHDRRADLLAERQTPAVTVGWRRNPKALATVIDFDQKGVIRIALNALYGLGHRRIAFISGPTTQFKSDPAPFPFIHPTFGARLEAFQSLATEMGVYRPDHVLFDEDFLGLSGTRHVQQWLELEDRPTAVLAFNDICAISFQDACRARGIRIPEEVSIMGIDNILISEDPTTALSTVDLPAEFLGREAIRWCMKRRESSNVEGGHISGGHFIQRASTGSARSMR